MLVIGDALKERRQKEQASPVSLSKHWLFLCWNTISPSTVGQYKAKRRMASELQWSQPAMVRVPKTESDP